MEKEIIFCKPNTNSEPPPQKLYIYRNTFNLNYLKDYLEGKIHLAYSDSFNDPFDVKFDEKFNVSWYCKTNSKTMLRRVLRFLTDDENRNITQTIKKNICEKKGIYSFVEMLELINSFIANKDKINIDTVCARPAEMMNDINDNYSYPYRIACFTENFDSIPMWAYYGESNYGICIEYDLTLLDSKIKLNKQIISSISKVNYTNKRQIKDGSFKSDAYFTKCEAWKHEREWRLVCKMDNEFLEFPCVSGIYLGVYFLKNKKEKIDEIYDIINSLGYADKVYKMQSDQINLTLQAKKFCIN